MALAPAAHGIVLTQWIGGELVRHQSPSAASRNVALNVTIAPEASLFFFDPALLLIALSNLLQNAIQASRPGGTIAVNAAKSQGKIEILVADQGEGISPKNLENIFNPFFTTKANGVGLGLAIVAKIVDEHQGEISASSDLGKGTTFRIVLPAVTS